MTMDCADATTPVRGGRALLLVQREFLSAHVGVRRVILHYARTLLARGDTLTLAAPDGQGGLVEGLADLRLAAAPVGSATAAPVLLEPSWTSGERIYCPRETGSETAHQGIPIRWTNRPIRPEDHDHSLLTVPWLCTVPVPPTPRLSGIIYDMVPNLLSLGVLRMPLFAQVHAFAHEHHLGYQHLLDHAQRILCISASTEQDFRQLYRLGPQAPETLVDIPYVAPDVPATEQRDTRMVLLVNAFDPRKNIANATRALLAAARHATFKVEIVGRERMAIEMVMETLNTLADAGLDVRWHRDASDPQLESLYHQAGVLLFPSLYEGLGLPILEAQAAGVPVVSSNISSCAEINLNEGLAVDADDPQAIEAALLDVLLARRTVLAGGALRTALDDFLARHSAPVAALTY